MRAALLFLCCCMIGNAYADNKRIATLLLRIGQYTQFTEAQHTLQFCLLPNDPLTQHIKLLLPQFPEYQNSLLQPENAELLQQCDIFWSPYPFWPEQAWLTVLQQQPILWISDYAALYGRGVLIQLSYDPAAYRYNVHRQHALQRGIRFDARLLQLAQDVR